jgi:hypothetical protein
VLVTSGVGVLVMILFVVFVAAGARSMSSPGDRVAVVESTGPAGIAVLTGRCKDQRVRSVDLRGPDQQLLWEVSSTKGSINRRWVVGGEVPVDAEELIEPVLPLPAQVTAEARFVDEDGEDGVEIHDSRTVQLDALSGAARLGDAAPSCGRRVGLGPVATALFGLGSAVVLVGYAVMVGRWWRVRRSGPR